MEIIYWILYTSLAAAPLIYWYLTRKFNHWTNLGIKGPKPIPLFGNILEFIFFSPWETTELAWYRKYGKIYGYYIGNSPVLTVADPELIKTVLVKDFNLFPDRQPMEKDPHPITSKNLVKATGDDWKRIRSIVSPTFTSGKMKKMYPMIRECLNDFINHLESFAINKKDINAKHMYGNYTMDVIATCAFATKINPHKNLDSPFLLNARKVFSPNVYQMMARIVFPKFLIRLLGINVNLDAHNFFCDSIRFILEKRRNSDKKYNDFVQLLIEAEKDKDNSRDDMDSSESHHVNEGEEEINAEKNALNINLINKHLTETEIVAQAYIFFVAGYETTATALTFTTYELALNPEIQEKLYEEINNAVDSEGELSYEVLANLPYLDSVISESLRLHSPSMRVSRMASTDYKLGETGITLLKGQLIEFPTYAMHHSEEFYPEPFTFNPDRFMPENRHLIKPYTYLPFGAGPRSCIGMRFALLEAKLGLAQIIRRFRFVRSVDTDVPLNYKINPIRINAPKRVIVGIERRT